MITNIRLQITDYTNAVKLHAFLVGNGWEVDIQRTATCTIVDIVTRNDKNACEVMALMTTFI